MNDRIKLAEAMGWKWSLKDVHCKTGEWVSPEGFAYPNWCLYEELPFYPFTDANDDYAVLEWMRKTQDRWEVIEDAMESTDFLDYQVGDYARAALKEST